MTDDPARPALPPPLFDLLAADDAQGTAAVALTAAAAVHGRGEPRGDWFAAVAALDAAMRPGVGPEWVARVERTAERMADVADPDGTRGLPRTSPAAWTDPGATAAELRDRLEELEKGEPRDWTREGMVGALDDGDDVARDVVKVATIDAGGVPMVGGSAAADGLAREWAGRMGEAAALLLPALFPDDADAADLRALADRFAAWLDRQDGDKAPAAAAELRRLRDQEGLFHAAPVLSDDGRPMGWAWSAPPRGGGEARAPASFGLMLALLRPDLVLARLTWEWPVRGWWEAKRPRPPALALPAAQAVLALRTRNPAPRRWTADGRELAELDTGGGTVRLDPFACATMPRDVAARLVAGDLRDLRSKAGLGVLDVVLRELDAALRSDPALDPSRAAPRLYLPAGKRLAEACRLPAKGTAARDAEAALCAWSAVYLGDYRGTLQRFLAGLPERFGGGRAGAQWRVVPGELLFPAHLAAAASDLADDKRGPGLPRNMRPWRRVMPWPDVPAPDGWAPRDCDRADAGFVALSLALDWTEAAGRAHGQAWQDAPGVVLDDRGWGALVQRAHAASLLSRRGNALDALGDAGWVEVDGDRVAPGPALPRLRGVLDDAAAGAQSARGKGRRRRRRKA